MPQLSLYLFDHPRIEMRGNPIQFDRKKALAILIFLACEPKLHSREKLTYLFWAGYPQKAARHNLNNTLSSLRKTVGGKWLEVSWRGDPSNSSRSSVSRQGNAFHAGKALSRTVMSCAWGDPEHGRRRLKSRRSGGVCRSDAREAADATAARQ